MPRKNLFRDYKRAHWPMLAAFEAGDVNHYAALVERNVERAEIARRAPSCCIFCHSLQVVTPTGFAFCPYRDPGNHARAREFNLGGEYERISTGLPPISADGRHNGAGDQVRSRRRESVARVVRTARASG